MATFRPALQMVKKLPAKAIQRGSTSGYVKKKFHLTQVSGGGVPPSPPSDRRYSYASPDFGNNGHLSNPHHNNDNDDHHNNDNDDERSSSVLPSHEEDGGYLEILAGIGLSLCDDDAPPLKPGPVDIGLAIAVALDKVPDAGGGGSHSRLKAVIESYCKGDVKNASASLHLRNNPVYQQSLKTTLSGQKLHGSEKDTFIAQSKLLD